MPRFGGAHNARPLMVSYRKPKKPRGFKDGGAVPVDDIVVAPAEALASAPDPAPAPEDDPVKNALEGTLRAEQMQRRQPTLEEHIDAMPISAFKKNMLKTRPEIRDPANALMVRFHHQAAMDAGIEDDSPEMEAAILAGIQSERQRAIDMAKRTAEKLTRPNPDIEAHVLRVDAPPETEPPIVRVEVPKPLATPAPASPARRTVPVSAPVSRDVPMASSGRRGAPNRTLSAEERDIAHRSFTATDMTDTQKELLYLQNREKLHRMRESGEYRRTTEQSG